MKKQKNSRLNYAVLALILPVAALTTLIACSVDKPQSPSWLTTWSVPITNKTYDINEILEDIDNFDIVLDSAGNPGFGMSQAIDTIQVEGNLTVSGMNVSIRDSVGLIDIAPPGSATATTDVNDLITVNLGVIPPASFNYDQALDTVSNYSWMDVQSGDLVLSFANTLDCDLDTFIVTIIDLADMHTVGVTNFLGGLPDNATKADTIALDGQRLSNTLSMNFQGATLAGGVIVGAGPHSIAADMSFPSNLTVSGARAETPEITKSQTQLTALSDSTVIQSSVIESGTLQFDIANNTQMPFTINVTSANFQFGGSDLTIIRQVAGNSSVLVTTDLAGYSFVPVDSPSTQYVSVDFSAIVPASAPSQNTISADDSLSMDVTLSTITFSSITGQIQPTVVNLPVTQQDLDIPEGMDQARLTQAEMTLNLYNNSTVPADLDITISGDGRSINIAGRIEGKLTMGDPALLTSLIVNSNELSTLLNPPPDTISISGSATLNPDFEIATITGADYIYGDVEIYSPFALAITDPIEIDMDISSSEIDSSSRPDNFTETFRYGAVSVDLESYLPLGVALTVYIGTVSDSGLYTDPNTLILGPDSLLSGITDPSGRVVESVLSQISYTLTSADLAIFDNDTVYFGQQISLLATDSSGVQIMGDDFIKIRANATLQVQIGDNLWNEN